MCVITRLARFYSDAQELLFSDSQFLQLGRLWKELNAMSNFMDILRTHPEQVSGQYSRLSSTYYKNSNRSKSKVTELIVGSCFSAYL